MEKLAQEGRTVLVVSHSMATVRALCSRAILLHKGTVKTIGPAEAVVADYLRAHRADPAVITVRKEDHRTGVKEILVKRISLLDAPLSSFAVYWQQPISISLEVKVLESIKNVAFGAGIRGLDGTHILTVHHDQDNAHPLWSFEPGEYVIQFTLENVLTPGLYKLEIGADHEHIPLKNVLHIDAGLLEVLDHTQQGATKLPSLTGVVNGRADWRAPVRLNFVPCGSPGVCDHA
jgi:lipopolysaccharide transport system ATP-binding protein